MTDTPRFSIVIPAYNAAETIGAALDSVIAQDFDSWEVVVTDDGSTDATAAICAEYGERDPRIHCASQTNQGAGAAITASVERSRGEYAVMLGADDELLPTYCSVTATFIDEHPGYDIYASNAYRVLPDGSRVIYHEPQRFQSVFSLSVDDLLDESQIHGTAAFRRGLFDELGGFRTEFHNEDYDFWLRALMAGARHVYNPVPLALYRVVAGQKTEDAIRMRSEEIKVLAAAIDSGGLTPEQVEHAQRTIALLQHNIAFRRRVTALVGPRLAGPVFRLAHRLAWIVRPYRKRK